MGTAAVIRNLCGEESGRGGCGGRGTRAVWREGVATFMGLVAGCFPRRETRHTLREGTEAVLMGLEPINCSTLAEALGHSGPHRGDRGPVPRQPLFGRLTQLVLAGVVLGQVQQAAGRAIRRG